VEGPTASCPTGEGIGEIGDRGRGLVGDSKRPPDPAIPDPTIRKTSNSEKMAKGRNHMRLFTSPLRWSINRLSLLDLDMRHYSRRMALGQLYVETTGRLQTALVHCCSAMAIPPWNDGIWLPIWN